MLTKCKGGSLEQHQDQNPVDYPPTSKEFSQVKMVGAQGLLGEFINMVNQLTEKNCDNISHIEVPT